MTGEKPWSLESLKMLQRLNDYYFCLGRIVLHGEPSRPLGSGGIVTTTESVEPVVSEQVQRDILDMAKQLHDTGAPQPYTVYGLDVGGEPDLMAVTLRAAGGDVITVYIDPWSKHAGNRDVFSPPQIPREALKLKREKPWVALNRKPWERKR